MGWPFDKGESEMKNTDKETRVMSPAEVALKRVLRDLLTVQQSLGLALVVLEAHGYGCDVHMQRAVSGFSEAQRGLYAEIESIKKYLASGEPERLAALDAEGQS